MCEVCTSTTKEIERLKAWRKRQRALCGEVPRKAYYDEYHEHHKEARSAAAKRRYQEKKIGLSTTTEKYNGVMSHGRLYGSVYIPVGDGTYIRKRKRVATEAEARKWALEMFAKYGVERKAKKEEKIRLRAPKNSREARENKQRYNEEYRERTREQKRQYDRERYAARKKNNELLRHTRKTAEDKNERALSV